MYVCWKSLFGVGAIFWLSLCLYDSYFINPTTKFLYSSTDEYEWLNQVSEDEIVEDDTYTVRDDIKFPFEGYNFGISLLLWNFVAFITTFVICSAGKISLIYFMEWQAKYSKILHSKARQFTVPFADTYQAILARRINISSKIPVSTSFSNPKTNICVPEPIVETTDKQTFIESTGSLLSSSTTSMDGNVRITKSEITSRLEQQMEKQCAKLRDEMIVVQANSLKEHAALSRKLESVSREKRDLCKQLIITQKENRAAKEQLEELLSEKTLLVKRLECASKEFKMNTKSKKIALANLEQSQVTISSLRQELEKINHEKEILENKFKILEGEYKNLENRLASCESPTRDSENLKLDNNKDCFQSKLGTNNVTKDTKRSHLHEISQSHKEVEKVQKRLINLEKSLDKLKYSNWAAKNDVNSSNTNSCVQDQISTSRSVSEEFNNYVTTITTHAETKKPENKPMLNDNLTDEQRRRILEPESSGDEYSAASKNYDNYVEREEDPFERVGNLLGFVKGVSESHFSSVYDQLILDTTTSSVYEDDTTDEFEPPSNSSRMVSNSPAFRKFLMKMDPTDRTNKKFTA